MVHVSTHGEGKNNRKGEMSCHEIMDSDHINFFLPNNDILSLESEGHGWPIIQCSVGV